MKLLHSLSLVLVGVVIGLPIGLYINRHGMTAREACIMNLKQIDDVKQQWLLASTNETSTNSSHVFPKP